MVTGLSLQFFNIDYDSSWLRKLQRMFVFTFLAHCSICSCISLVRPVQFLHLKPLSLWAGAFIYIICTLAECGSESASACSKGWRKVLPCSSDSWNAWHNKIDKYDELALIPELIFIDISNFRCTKCLEQKSRARVIWVNCDLCKFALLVKSINSSFFFFFFFLPVIIRNPKNAAILHHKLVPLPKECNLPTS